MGTVDAVVVVVDVVVVAGSVVVVVDDVVVVVGATVVVVGGNVVVVVGARVVVVVEVVDVVVVVVLVVVVEVVDVVDVVDVEVVDVDVVLAGSPLKDSSYCSFQPGLPRHTSGCQQHVPARKRYRPGCTSTEMYDCKPKESSLLMINVPSELYSHS